MLAESLRHALGDLSDEGTEIRVDVNGRIYSVIGTVERDRTFVLVTYPEPMSSTRAAPDGGEEHG